MRTATRLLACLLLACAAHAQDSDGGGPTRPYTRPGRARGGHRAIRSREDAAPEGIVSRASGRPDHPRTLEEIVKTATSACSRATTTPASSSIAGTGWAFDYEIGKKLAQSLGIRVDMIIHAELGEMVPALLRGEGDVIAAEVTVNDERRKEVLFAEPWGHTRE